MLRRQVEELTLETFNSYGRFVQAIDPTTPKLGERPIEFFRDMLQVDLGCSTKASFSILRVEKRPQIIDVMEHHNTVGEVNLPLDNDVLMYVAAATALNEFNSEDVRVFRVPRGTVVSLHVGVWHQAAFVADAEYANILVVLPERLYAKDCIVHKLKDFEQIEVVH